MTRTLSSAPFDVGAGTHVGLVRNSNEDNFIARSDIGLWAVADGMGGHDAGEIASAAIVESLASIEPPESAALLLRQCEERLFETNAAIRDIATRTHRGTIGSTVVVLLAHEKHFACLWAGDSRIYLLRGADIRQLTRDHSEVADLLAEGLLTEEEAQRWPRRNIITRAVGGASKLELDFTHDDLAAGDIFILCSDGLTGHVDAHEIAATVASKKAQDACDDLIGLALKRGGRDNVTVVVVCYRPSKGDTVARPGVRPGLPPPFVWE